MGGIEFSPIFFVITFKKKIKFRYAISSSQASGIKKRKTIEKNVFRRLITNSDGVVYPKTMMKFYGKRQVQQG